MRILFVASFNHGHFAPFIIEQAEVLRQIGCEVSLFGVKGRGLEGYLKGFLALKKRIKVFQPTVIHAHYGLSGLMANLQRRVPVVTTYHGSDINDKRVLPFSKMAMRLSAWNVFVSQKTLEIVCPKRKFSLLPCGVDLCVMQLTEKSIAKRRIGLDPNKSYILFAGAFDNPVKNAALAQQAVEYLHDNKVELLELKGYTREQVTLLMCSVDVLLMTSVSEGSPQVIKEAMASGCPIVSVDVGDVRERIAGVSGCYVADTYSPKILACLLNRAIAFLGRTSGRDRIIEDGLDNKKVAKRLSDIYNKVVHE